jgi:branched-chain amino acid transport system permease protein
MIYGAPPLSWEIPQALRGQFIVAISSIPSTARCSSRSPSRAWRASGSCCSARPSGGVVRAGVQNPEMVGRARNLARAVHGERRLHRHRARGARGVMLAPIFAVHPAMGQEIITAAFVVVVIGGLGPSGAW